MTKWTHVRVTRDTLELLRLISYLSGVPVSTVLRVFAEEGVKVYEADWEARDGGGDGVRADEPAQETV